MNGIDMTLMLEGKTVGATRGVTLTMKQEAEQYDLLPVENMVADEGWMCFRPGKRSWSIGHQGLFCPAGAEWVAGMLGTDDSSSGTVARVRVAKGPSVYLVGKVHLNNISVEAGVESMAKINAEMVGDDFPVFG